MRMYIHHGQLLISGMSFWWFLNQIYEFDPERQNERLILTWFVVLSGMYPWNISPELKKFQEIMLSVLSYTTERVII